MSRCERDAPNRACCAVDWAAAALQKVAQFEANYIGGRSACFNIGRIDGGLKNNMIAGRCLLSWSARLPSGVSNDAILGLLTVPAQDYVSWQSTFAGSSLPRDDHQLEIVEQICGAVGLKVGEPVDFWTEASIFSDHGKPAFVFGPGNIAQAHTPDEWVSVEVEVRGSWVPARRVDVPFLKD